MNSALLKLNENDPHLKQVLWTGKWNSQKAVLLEVYEAADGISELSFKLEEPESSSLRESLKRFLISLRLYSLPASLLPAVAVLLMSLYFGQSITWYKAFLAILGLGFLHFAVNLYNDVFDYLRLIDAPGERGGSGAILKSWFSAKYIFSIATIFLFLGVSCGVAALWGQWLVLAVIVATAVLAVVGYSNRPFGFKYRALGDLVVFFTFGPVLTVGVELAARASFSLSSLFIGVFFGLGAVGLLHVNNLEDIPIDQKRGAKTIASLMGFSKARKFLFVIYFLMFAVAVIAISFGLWPKALWVLPLILVVAFVPLARRAMKASGPYSPQMENLRIEAAKIHMLTGLGFCFSIALLLFWS
ncbi:MAG: prenyltransferase [Bdellovibrionota bacterium]